MSEPLARCVQAPGALRCRYSTSFTSPVSEHRSPPPARGRCRHGSSDGAAGPAGAPPPAPGARRGLGGAGAARGRLGRWSEQRAGIGEARANRCGRQAAEKHRQTASEEDFVVAKRS